MLNGALVLMIATAIGSIIGALYKLPLTALIGEVGRGYFASAYQIYVPIYAISMGGLPVAVSKLVSEYFLFTIIRNIKFTVIFINTDRTKTCDFRRTRPQESSAANILEIIFIKYMHKAVF